MKNSKKLSPYGSVSSKYSTKDFKCSSSSSKFSVKSSEILLKLYQDTGKAKIFADQTDEPAKRKLVLIKRRQELKENETLNVVPEAKKSYSYPRYLRH